MISKLWEVISILLTFLMLFLATASKLSGSPIWYYVAVPTIIMGILLVIHFIRKEIKYRQFCKDFWD